jgi:thiosulfate/3-mercaptopyruvate sulfurtransferase
MKRIIIVLTALMSLATLSAQLISVDELTKLMKDPKVVVVDARPAADYMKTHINGAINIDASTLSNATPVEGTLKPVTELASIFGKHGLSTSSKIVIYCKTGINAGRVYWILKYLGASDVSMLDGQMDAWFGARKPITKNPKKLAAATFTPAVNAAIKADKAYVKSKLSTAVLIDTRKKEEYAAGKIGTAINIPSDDMISGSKLKTAAELTKLFASVPKDKEVIVYCKTGVSAGLTYFVLKSVLNYPKVRLYEGAWVDWSN